MEQVPNTKTLFLIFPDLCTIYNSELLDPDKDPSSLQKKVMFDIRYYICRQGGENIKDMTKNTFQLEYDPETRMSYVRKIVDEIQKNHQETNEEIITGFMPQIIQPNGMPHKLYPVQAFENYLGKLNPNSDKLCNDHFINFQKIHLFPGTRRKILVTTPIRSS